MVATPVQDLQDTFVMRGGCGSFADIRGSMPQQHMLMLSFSAAVGDLADTSEMDPKDAGNE